MEIKKINPQSTNPYCVFGVADTEAGTSLVDYNSGDRDKLRKGMLESGIQGALDVFGGPIIAKVFEKATPAVKPVLQSVKSKFSKLRPNLKQMPFNSSMREVVPTSEADLYDIAKLRQQANLKEIESPEEFNRLLNLGYSENEAIDLMSKMSTSATKAPITVEPAVENGTFGMYHPNEHTVSLYNTGKGPVEEIAGTVDHEWGAHAATRGVIDRAEAKSFKIPYGNEFADLVQKDYTLLNGEKGLTPEVTEIVNALQNGNQELAVNLGRNHFGVNQVNSIDDLMETLEYGFNPQEVRARMWQSRMKQKLTGQTFNSQYNDPSLQLTDMGWLKKFYKLPNLNNYYNKFAVTTGTVGTVAKLDKEKRK